MAELNNSGGQIHEKKSLSGTAGLWRHHTRLIDPDHGVPESLNGSAVLVGFACDEGVRRNNGRPGAQAGPEAIRNALARLAWHAVGEFLDAGDIPCDRGDLETAQAAFAGRITRLLKAGGFPVCIGGGHEIAFAHYSGIRDFIGDKPLGIIIFDAHFDMRIPVNGQSNSGTSFYQIARHCTGHQWPFHYLCLGIQKANNTHELFQTAARYHASWIEATDIHMMRNQELKNQLDHFLENVGHVYLSFCLDVFHASVAPGVSAVNPLGLFPDIVMLLVRHIFASRKVISMDIAELNPLFDIDDRTAKLAAAIIFRALEWKAGL